MGACSPLDSNDGHRVIGVLNMDLGQSDVHTDRGVVVKTTTECSEEEGSTEMDANGSTKEPKDKDEEEEPTEMDNAGNRFGDAIGDANGDDHGKHMKGECVEILMSEEHTLALSDPAQRKVWIQVAKQGVFRGHHSGRPFQMNSQTFTEIIQNFRATKNRAIPVDFEHASEQAPTEGNIATAGAPSQGWITDLAVRADGNLWGLVEWLALAKKYIKAKQYRFLSPAIMFGATDRVTGKPIGAILSSVALTNNPFLDGMQPIAAKHGIGYSTPPNDAFKAIRKSLEMPDAVTPDSLLAMMTTSGYSSLPMGKVRDALRLPLTYTDEQVFDLALVACGKKVSPPASPVVLQKNEPVTAKESIMTESNREKELETQIAQLKLQSNEAQAEIKQLKDSHAAEVLKLTNEKVELTTKLDEHTARETQDLVDVTLATYGEKKGLTEADRPTLMSFAKGMPEEFRKMYPLVPANQRHLGTTIASGAHKVEHPNFGLGQRAVQMSGNGQANGKHIVVADIVREANIPDVAVLAGQMVEESRKSGILMSREQAFSAAHDKRKQLIQTAANKALNGNNGG